MSYWQQTRFPGVRFREHASRKINGRPDKYFTVRYRTIDGKRKEESLGWASEGWTPAKANAELVTRMKGDASQHKPKPTTRKLPVKPLEDQQVSTTQSVTQNHIPSTPPPLHQPPSTTFKAAAELFVEWAKTNKKSWTDDEQRLKKHVFPLLGRQALNAIGFPEVERLKARCQLKGLAPASVVQCLAVTKSVFNFASKMRLFDGINPVKGVKFPRVNNGRIRFLTHEEAKQLLDTAARYNGELHDMCLLCLYTGMRAGEMTALRWSDVNFEYGFITIRDSKNGSTRQVFMVDNIKEMLMNRKKTSLNVLIFPSNNGEQRVRVSKIFQRLADKLNLNERVEDSRHKVVFHTLRHTFASWLALQGETLLTIKELMGHKTLAMTMRYAHLIPDEKRKAVERLACGGY